MIHVPSLLSTLLRDIVTLLVRVCTEKGKEGDSEQLVPHVPKLRRTHAVCVSNEAPEIKGRNGEFSK